MGTWQIDLNFYGPHRSLEALRAALDGLDERRILYMARHANLQGLAVAKGHGGEAAKPSWNARKSGVAYVGITQQDRLSARFRNHHAIGDASIDELAAASGLALQLDEFYAGFFFRKERLAPEASRHVLDARLKAAEDVMICWFLPPLNVDGIDRTGGREVGRGPGLPVNLRFYWYGLDDRPSRAPAGFPKSIAYRYQGSAGTVEATF